MDKTLLTIVTINRNNARGLERTIASALSLRNDPDVEFLFIDGASVDDSVPVAETFYWHGEILSEPDKGIYDAMNKGLALATGKYVIWINSGDEFIASSWHAIKPYLDCSSAAVIAGGIEIPASPQSVQSGQSSRQLFCSPAQLPRFNLHHQAVFFLRAAALAYGGYSLQYKIVSDRHLVLKLFMAGQIFEYIPCMIARFEEGGISSMHEMRELENFNLDHEIGLISTSDYFQGIARHFIYYRFTIPVWSQFKLTAARLGIAVPPRPMWLKSLFARPDRGSFVK